MLTVDAKDGTYDGQRESKAKLDNSKAWIKRSPREEYTHGNTLR